MTRTTTWTLKNRSLLKKGPSCWEELVRVLKRKLWILLNLWKKRSNWSPRSTKKTAPRRELVKREGGSINQRKTFSLKKMNNTTDLGLNQLVLESSIIELKISQKVNLRWTTTTTPLGHRTSNGCRTSLELLSNLWASPLKELWTRCMELPSTLKSALNSTLNPTPKNLSLSIPIQVPETLPVPNPSQRFSQQKTTWQMVVVVVVVVFPPWSSPLIGKNSSKMNEMN